MDEHRVGLKPVIRRVCWASRGHRPVIRVQQRYEWLYVSGFARPETGESHWLLLPSVNIEVFTIALEQFAQAVGAGLHRRIILGLDRAGWHNSQMLVIPEGIHLVFLPPYSPELQRMSSTSGHSPTRRLLIAALRRSTSCVAGPSTTLCCSSERSDRYPSCHAFPLVANIGPRRQDPTPSRNDFGTKIAYHGDQKGLGRCLYSVHVGGLPQIKGERGTRRG